MMRTGILAAVMMVAAAGGASAQEHDVFFFHGEMGPAPAQGGATVPAPPMFFERTVDVMMAEPLDAGEPVTGAPYSANAVTEVIQQLVDGNRIERRSTSSIARDSQGRLRRTQPLAAIGPLMPAGDAEMVTINDPVAKTHYFLQADRKVAIQSPPMFTRRLDGPPPAPPSPSALPQVAGVPVPRDSRTEQLGSRDFGGISAEGTRSVVTIAAGAIGNSAPIEIVSERWYSPELKTVVYSTRSDPRFGETIFRLENIDRSEPSPELFQVPSDYSIQSGPPFGAGVRIERRIERPVGQ